MDIDLPPFRVLLGNLGCDGCFDTSDTSCSELRAFTSETTVVAASSAEGDKDRECLFLADFDLIFSDVKVPSLERDLDFFERIRNTCCDASSAGSSAARSESKDFPGSNDSGLRLGNNLA